MFLQRNSLQQMRWKSWNQKGVWILGDVYKFHRMDNLSVPMVSLKQQTITLMLPLVARGGAIIAFRSKVTVTRRWECEMRKMRKSSDLPVRWLVLCFML